MDGQIAQLQIRYQFFGDSLDIGGVRSRLDAAVQSGTVEALDAALTEALGDDPAVYILRQVHVTSNVNLSEQGLFSFVQRWGEHLGERVVQQVGAGDPSLVMRFDDQAAYLAHFLHDLLCSEAWSHWYYFPLGDYRSMTTREAARTLLIDQRQHLGAILARLHRSGDMESLIRVLGPAVADVWRAGTETDSTPDMLRPVFAEAIALADALDLWTGPPASIEALFQQYVISPLRLDWRSRESLTDGVTHILYFLKAQAHLKTTLNAPTREQFMTVPISDWLDAVRLRQSLIALWGAKDLSDLSDLSDFSAAKSSGAYFAAIRDAWPPSLAEPGPAGTPPPYTLPPGLASPRRQRLLTHLAHVLQAGAVRLDRRHPLAEANSIRWYAALVESYPDWLDDSLAVTVIHDLLDAWNRLLNAPGELHTEQIEVGAANREWQTLLEQMSEFALPPRGEPDHRPPAPRIPGARAGVSADRLSADTYAASPAPSLGMQTTCAGIFLLLRTIQAVRLISMVTRSGYPGDPALMLAALATTWAEPTAYQPDNRLDPAVALLAGLSDTLTVGGLCEAWNAPPDAHYLELSADLTSVLIGQRLLSAEQVVLHQMPNSKVLIASNASGRIIPWVVAENGAAQATSDWLDALALRLGQPPTLLAVADPAATGQALNAIEALALWNNFRGLEDIRVRSIAAALLQSWAFWLSGFADSSVPYVLNQFIRRAGWLVVDPHVLVVILEHKPLDLVLSTSGCLTDMGDIPWLAGRTVRFRIEDL